jgi:hypothetical protein
MGFVPGVWGRSMKKELRVFSADGLKAMGAFPKKRNVIVMNGGWTTTPMTRLVRCEERMQRRPGPEGQRTPQGVKRPVENRNTFQSENPQRPMAGLAPRAAGPSPQMRREQGRPLPPQHIHEEDEEALYTHPFAQDGLDDEEGYGAYRAMAAAPVQRKQKPQPMQALPRDSRMEPRAGMPIPPAKRGRRNIAMGVTLALLVVCALILFVFQTGLLTR